MKPSLIVHGGAGSGKFGKDDRRFSEMRRAVEEGLAAMRKGSSLDGVEAAVNWMEDSGAFNSGLGACLTSEGKMELDAAVMSGERLVGAGVGSVTCTHNPVSLARWVAENTGHVLIVGGRCKDYARLAGIEIEELSPSAEAREKFRKMSADSSNSRNISITKRLQGGSTVGAVAIDSAGVPAAAVSTGGVWMKLPGRVGDSAVLGAGIYAHSGRGAACATGTGEEIIRCALSLRACDFLKGAGAPVAARKAVSLMTKERGRGTAGIITVDIKGHVGAACNTAAMGRSWFEGVSGRSGTSV